MGAIQTVLIGLGKIGSSYALDPKSKVHFDYLSHAQVLKDHPDFECIAAIDPYADELLDEAATWNIPAVYKTTSDLDVAPDLAVIATPPIGRLEVIKALPDTLKAVIIEKPLAESLGEAEQIVKYCKSANIFLLVNYWRRFDSVLRYWREHLDEKIGEVQTGFVVYGGGLLNNGSHVIDCLRYLCGELDVRGSEEGFKAILKTGATINAIALDFQYYREISIDLWGTKGRFELFQESLYIRHSMLSEHRALSGAQFEINSLDGEIYKTGAGKALYNLYDHTKAVIFDYEELKSSGDDALVNQKLLDKLVT